MSSESLETSARPVLFNPLEGRRRGYANALISPSINPRAKEIHKQVKHHALGNYCFSFTAGRKGFHPPRYSNAKRPRVVQSNLALYIGRVEAIKGSVAVCRTCIRMMRRYCLSQFQPNGYCAELLATGRKTPVSQVSANPLPGARSIRPALPFGASRFGEVRGLMQGQSGVSFECWYDLLRRLSAVYDMSPGLPGARLHAPGDWACPYCAFNDNGTWKSISPEAYEYERRSACPDHELLYALPYITTHIMIATGRITPPPVSHLTPFQAHHDAFVKGVMVGSLDRPASYDDYPGKELPTVRPPELSPRPASPEHSPVHS